MSAQYLKAWLAEFQPKGTNVWGVNFRGYTDHYDHQGFGQMGVAGDGAAVHSVSDL